MTTEAEKQRAHGLVAAAIKSGRLEPPIHCESCGSTDASMVYHHWDYSQPLDVIPLCGSCHRRVHAGSVAEPRTGKLYPQKPRHPTKVIRIDEKYVDQFDEIREAMQRRVGEATQVSLTDVANLMARMGLEAMREEYRAELDGLGGYVRREG